jgi:ABC-type nitrate/sulfonate/bicarbonate transport system substrate-binding protein
MADIKMAFGDRLETQHLLSGRVTIEGFDIDFTNPGNAPAPTFNDTVTKLSYDVSELTAANFIIAKDAGVPIIGLPIVPNVFYPLTGMMVNKEAGIATVQDLTAKRIAVTTGFASNPAVWLRGVLTHQFDLDVEGITWIEGDADSLRGIDYPRNPRYRTEKLPDLASRLAAGDVDALIGAGGAAAGSDEVGLLMPDASKELNEYFSSTNCLPINTLMVMQEESRVKYPGLAEAVIAAADKAHAIYDAEEPDDGIHQGLSVGLLRKAGIFPRPHGLATHGDSFKALALYLYEQGHTKKHWTLEELFV